MKRTVLLPVSVLLLLSTLLAGMTACKAGNDEEPEETESTVTIDKSHYVPDTKIPELAFQKDLNTLVEAVPAKASETYTGDGFTAVTTDEAWLKNSGIDYSVYDYVGAGAGLIEEVAAKYKNAKTVTYYIYDVEKASRKVITDERAGQLSNAMAFFYYKEDTRVLSVYIQQVDVRVLPEYKSINGGAGYFMTVDFTTNVPGTFIASIGDDKSVLGNTYHEGIVAKGADGIYKATAKMTIPFLKAGDYYLNISLDGGSDNRTFIKSIPITITESQYSTREFHLLYTGDWDLITAAGYQDNLTKLFYNTYPRLYARWGNGTEPKTITFRADPAYDGVAYAMGTTVTVSTVYANGHPNDLGFFSHEITHSVQQYNGFNYGGDAWWTENMANYGGFRYFHWSNAKYVQVYQANEASLQNWNYEPYGNNKWFFAYMDAKYPTTVDKDGKYTYGLIDSLNRAIKAGTLTDDDPRDTANPFNIMVKEITGYDCIESLRLHYVEELKAGTWAFVGFGDYTDNFITEDLENVENPDYPMVQKAVHGQNTSAALKTSVTTGDNLTLGSTVTTSGEVNASESGAMLVDGKPATKWCCSSSSDPSYCLDGTKFWAVIDLGEKKSFNTYTIYNTKSAENFGNMSEWEILVSDDNKTWVSVDYQKTASGNISSYNIGEQSARYILFRVYNGDGNNGTVRLYEFQLYNIAD